jgi:hypothetical protein
MKKISIIVSLFVIVLTITAYAQTVKAEKILSLDEWLKGSLVSALDTEYDTTNIEKTIDPILRSRIIEYLIARCHFRSRLKKPKDMTFPNDVVYDRQRNIEKAIVSLVRKDGVEQQAVKFIKNVPLAYEYEGFSDGFIGETEAAETFIKNDMLSIIKPYVNLFLMSRTRCAFECLVYEKNAPVAKKYSKRYKRYFSLAVNDPDILVVYLANIIDREKFSYMDVNEKP